MTSMYKVGFHTPVNQSFSADAPEAKAATPKQASGSREKLNKNGKQASVDKNAKKRKSDLKSKKRTDQKKKVNAGPIPKNSSAKKKK